MDVVSGCSRCWRVAYADAKSAIRAACHGYPGHRNGVRGHGRWHSPSLILERDSSEDIDLRARLDVRRDILEGAVLRMQGQEFNYSFKIEPNTGCPAREA